MDQPIGYRFSYKEVKKRLADFGLKATQQRIVVYEALLNMANHPTAEMVYEHVRKGNPSISLATIYKTLDTFVSSGLASKVHSNEGHMRYDANMHSHNHIYCTNTKEILDYENQELDQLIKEYFQKKNIHNLKIHEIQLQIHGEKLDPEKQIHIE